jgi:hypothetical protein
MRVGSYKRIARDCTSGGGKEKIWVAEGKGERQRAQATISRLEPQVEMQWRGRLICAKTIEFESRPDVINPCGCAQ